jgi:glutamate/tyrosine decarboxylase-like PLP-dependent enzyme
MPPASGGRGDGRDPFQAAYLLAREFLRGLPSRHVGARAPIVELRRELACPLPEEGRPAAGVIEALAAGAGPGLVASAGPRYFGFVTGGSLPAAVAADWLTTAWDQNGALVASSPAAAVVEEVVVDWLLDLTGLPRTASVGLVTGCQMANFTGLAAARHAVLAREGWDVAARGLRGAPPVRIVVGAEAHVTIHAALRMLGFGAQDVVTVEADDQGRLRADALEAAMRDLHPPLIVCAQAGNVNSGAFDPIGAIVDLSRPRGGWVHVDAAFGLWAAASPTRRHLTTGIERADSWASDGHKWLNVPYDCGIAIVSDSGAHRAAMTSSASYLERRAEGLRDPLDWVPEASRRARAFAVYAALRSIGRRGVADLVDRCCRHAALMSDLLKADPHVEILNEVVLNQVLARFHSGPFESQVPSPESLRVSDDLTRATVERVQHGSVCWAGGTIWHGLNAMRISVCNWATTADDIRESAAAILQAARTVRENAL